MIDIMKYFLYCLLFSLFSCHYCEEDIDEIRSQVFNFKIQQKRFEQSRYYTLIGKNKNGQLEKFHNMGYKDLYEASDLGDSILKVKGEIHFKVIKPDTVLVFHYICDGRILQ